MSTWETETDAWLLWQRGAGRAATTMSLRAYQLRRFAADHAIQSPWSITLDDLSGWLGAHDWCAETMRSYRAALRSFYRWGQRTQRIGHSPAEFLDPIKPGRALPRPAPEDVFRHALTTAEPRVHLMLMLAGFAGLRRGEISQVHTRDLTRDSHDPNLWVLRVHGKGSKERAVPLLPDLARHLRALPPGYAFPGDKSGPHLSAHYVGKLISRALPEEWTAHTLRHRFSARFYAAERDIRATQEVLGHASVATTQRYTPVPAGAILRSLANVA